MIDCSKNYKKIFSMVRSKAGGLTPSKAQPIFENHVSQNNRPNGKLSVFQSGSYTKFGATVNTKDLGNFFKTSSGPEIRKSRNDIQHLFQDHSIKHLKNKSLSPLKHTNGLSNNSCFSSPNTNKIKSPESSPLKDKTGQSYYHISRMKVQPALYRKMFGIFKEESDVLARWSDGLYYLGTVYKVDDLKHQCHVQFEDKSISAVHFKDMQLLNNGKSDDDDDDGEDSAKVISEELDSDVTCTLCRDGKSDPPNEIVLCDKCGQGYHQQCHAPSIDTSVLHEEDVPWQCRTCVFAAVAKRGGAESEGPAAAALKVMKQVLPYDISSLSWCKGHKVNTEEVYCYCGGPGDWYLKMLQCCRCQQWFHEACIQCLKTAILYGDRFYIFVCALCNEGEEYVHRLPMRWVDVVHLVLYNVTIAKTLKYYDFYGAIMPFFAQNWESLQLGDLVHEASTRSQLKDRVIETLQNNRTRFQCGSETKKAKMSWGLRTRSPPVPPSVSVPSCGLINDELLASMDLRHGSVLLSDSPTPLKRSAPGDQGSPTPKKKKESIEGEWTSKNLLDNFHDTSNDNIFDRFSFGSRRSSVKSSETSTSVEEMPKRRRGRPRKDQVVPPKPNGTRGRGRPSSGGVKLKRRKRQSSFSSEASSNIPVVDLLRESSSNGEVDPFASARDSNDKDLRRTMARYFGAEGRIACGERYRVLAKRVVNEPGGKSPRVEYLIEWEGFTARQLHESTHSR
uniref:Metal-response element-binding transcription factor 2 n=1 Tax=Phallusia mammillata TaxID=59560 RepID=A0A6F9DM31_9ASCI|nr:metal-response element-binding transcription factor 2 [Phallusia mammillata]